MLVHITKHERAERCWVRAQRVRRKLTRHADKIARAHEGAKARVVRILTGAGRYSGGKKG